MLDFRLAFYLINNIIYLATDDYSLVFTSTDKYLGDSFVSVIDDFLQQNGYEYKSLQYLVFQDEHISYTTSRLIQSYIKAILFYSNVYGRCIKCCSMSGLLPIMYSDTNNDGVIWVSNMKGGCFGVQFHNKCVEKYVELDRDGAHNCTLYDIAGNQAVSMLRLIDDADFVQNNADHIRFGNSS